MWLCGRCALWFFHYIQPSITHDFTLFKQFSAVKKRAKWGTTSIKSSLWYLDFDRSEYNAFWRCVQAGATYLFVQLCKVSEPCDTSLIRYIRHHLCASLRDTVRTFWRSVISLFRCCSLPLFSPPGKEELACMILLGYVVLLKMHNKKLPNV